MIDGTNVPFAALEVISARHDRTMKRMCIAFVIAVCVLAICTTIMCAFVTITMYEDGIPTASKAMSTAVADASVNMSLNALVKLPCYRLSKRISFVLSGVNSTIESADIVAIKL